MGYLRFNYRSQALGRFVDVSITYPTGNYSYYDTTAVKKGTHDDNGPARPLYRTGMKFQTLWLIHGGGDDDSTAMRYTLAERYAEENNVMIVCPDISNSFGIDTVYGVRYQTFLSEELPVVVRALFASSDKREDNFIAGFAMGGNVALGTAIMHPELYAACVDISGGIGLTLSTETLKNELESDHFKNFFRLYNTSFGESKDIDGSPYDLYRIAKEKKEAGETLPLFYILCGENEFIRERVEEDVRLLRELGYDPTYIMEPGETHDFHMFDLGLKKAFYELLPLKRKAE